MIDLNQKERGAVLSIFVYIILSAAKLFVGYTYGSNALTADGWNNLTDIFASVSVLIGLKIAKKPADRDHAYGHSRAETIASMVASFIMISIGLQVIYSAFVSFSAPRLSEPPLITAWFALLSAVVLWLVFFYNLRLSQKLKSEGLQATAYDNRADALVSMAAFFGILGARAGFPWLDPLAALIVGFVVCKTAWDIFRDTSHSLSDGFEYDALKKFKKTVAAVDGVEEVHDLKARRHGSEVIVDVTIKVVPDLDVVESHRITEEIEQALVEKHAAKSVQVHVEPTKESSW